MSLPIQPVEDRHTFIEKEDDTSEALTGAGIATIAAVKCLMIGNDAVLQTSSNTACTAAKACSQADAPSARTPPVILVHLQALFYASPVLKEMAFLNPEVRQNISYLGSTVFNSKVSFNIVNRK